MTGLRFPCCHSSREGSITLQSGTIQDFTDEMAGAIQVVASHFFKADDPRPLDVVRLGAVHVWMPNIIDHKPNELAEMIAADGRDFSKSKVAINVISTEEPDDVVDESVFKELTNALDMLFELDEIEYRIYRHDQTIVPTKP